MPEKKSTLSLSQVLGLCGLFPVVLISIPCLFMCFVFMWNPLQIWELCNPGILSEFAMQPAFNMGLLLFILAALPALVIWIGVRLRRFLLTDFIMVIIAAIAMVTTICSGREDHGSLYGPWTRRSPNMTYLQHAVSCSW
jgi:hypothetical protein